MLANGWLPVLSLEIKNIELAQRKNCGRVIPPIRIQKATLPINFFKLLEGKFALSLISIQKFEVDIENFQNNCGERSGASVATKPDQEASPPVVAQAAPDMGSGSAVKTASEAFSFWDDQKLSQIDEVVRGIEFDEIKLYFDQHQKFLILKNFNLRQNKSEGLSKSKYRLKSEFILPPEFSQGEVIPTADIVADLTSEKMNFDISTQIAEGHIQINAIISPGSHSPLVEMNIKAKQLPVSAISSYLTKLELLPQKSQPKFVWLSFTANVNGRLDQLKQLPIEASDILIDGEFGQAKISHLVRNADGGLSEFVLDLPKVQILKALDLFGTKGPDGIFSQFGELSGQLQFKSTKHFEFKGEWQDAALKFSRRGSRSEQVIESIQLDFTFTENRWKGKISQIELENGDFDGEIRLNFDHAFDEGDIEIVNENIEFDPSVQKNMFYGAVSGVKLNGKMNLKKFIIQSWDGELQIKSLEADELSFKQARLLSHFGGDRLSINAKVAEGEYKYSSELRKIEKQIFFNFEDRNENLIFTNLKADLVQSEGKWSWNALKASLLEDRIQLMSSGEVKSNDSLSGEINLDFPKAKKLIWKVDGSWEHPNLNPNSNNLKNLLSKKVDFKFLGLNSKEL